MAGSLSGINPMENDGANKTLINDIYDFLKKGEKETKFIPNGNIVLLLGNTGSGKSTFSQFIAGYSKDLMAKEVGEDTGDFIIVDKNNRVSSNSTVVSKTIFPDLVVDTKTNTTFYDCPGFSDTRSAAHEIAATYFIKKVISSARSVKLVFVVSHHSVKAGMDRKDFILMLKHSVDFIKNLDKYKNCVALVVTKVENKYIGRAHKLVSDEKVIRAIGQYLEQVRKDIADNPELTKIAGQTENNQGRALSLIDSLLQTGNGNYTRIGIFRRPDGPGALSDSELLIEGKLTLENIISKNIQFVEVASKDDFGYTLSSDSKLHINGLLEKINEGITKKLFNLGCKLEEYFNLEEEKFSEIERLEAFFKTLEDSFSKKQIDAINDKIIPEKFTEDIGNIISDQKITICNDDIRDIKKEEEYIEFLDLVSSQPHKNGRSPRLAAGLVGLVKYLKHSETFYRFLNDFYERLSMYDIQKNGKKYNIKSVNNIADLIDSPLFKLMEDSFKGYGKIRDIALNKPKLNLLNRILDITLNYKVESTCPASDRLVVKGLYVKLSDVDKDKCGSALRYIEVLALEKVFIDASFDLTGAEVQMSIVAPVWEVVGSQSIILDGMPGAEHLSSKAQNSGREGLPGNPGGPAGTFLGIGKHFIKEDFLLITANGGNGGGGQDGGNGSDGADGPDCKWCNKKNGGVLVTLFYNSGDEVYVGEPGYNGGNGGIGGYGGPRGNIKIIKVGSDSIVTRVRMRANDGGFGRHGKGGKGGKGGRYFAKKFRNYVLVVTQEYMESMNQWARDGIDGITGGVLPTRRPWTLKEFLNPDDVMQNYITYLKTNLNKTPKETFSRIFLNEIENSKESKLRKRRTLPIRTELDKNSNGDPVTLSLQTHGQYKNEGSKETDENILLEFYISDFEKQDLNNPLVTNWQGIEKSVEKDYIPDPHSNNEDMFHKKFSKNSKGFMTNGSSAFQKNSFFNNFINLVVSGLVSVRTWNFLLSGDERVPNQGIMSSEGSQSSVPIVPSILPQKNVLAAPLESDCPTNDDLFLNLNEQYCMSTNSNLLFWDLVLKTLTGRKTLPTLSKPENDSNKIHFASDLAYSHYKPSNI